MAAQLDSLAVHRPAGAQLTRDADRLIGRRVGLADPAPPAAQQRARVDRPQVADAVEVGGEDVHQPFAPDLEAGSGGAERKDGDRGG